MAGFRGSGQRLKAEEKPSNQSGRIEGIENTVGTESSKLWFMALLARSPSVFSLQSSTFILEQFYDLLR